MGEKNKSGRLSRSSHVFNSVIAAHELIDVRMSGGKFTWSNNQENPTLERLDRFFITKEWDDTYSRVVVYKLPREVSDHNLLILTTEENKHLSKLSFSFELSWLKHPNFLTTVQELWSKPYHASSAIGLVQNKLKRFKQYFKGWGFNIQGQQKKRKNDIHTELLALEIIEEESGLSLDQLQKIVSLKSKLMQILGDEELYWFKRSHDKWLHEDDLNTRYFQRIANARKRKNTIMYLKDGDSIIDGDDDLIQHATSYYTELFGLAAGNIFQIDPDLWEDWEKVTNDENEELIKPFTEEEVKNALFQMKKNKAAGPDSIPVEFYQNCWDIVKHDIMEIFHEFHQGSMDVCRINYGIITLLPKI